MAPRIGCYYCFETLDPSGSHAEMRSFVCCLQCQTIYHSQCWRGIDKCLHCSGDQAMTVQIAQPSTLRITTRTKAVPVRPTTKVYAQTTADGKPHQVIPWQHWLIYALHELGALVVALLLAGVATMITVPIVRLIGLDNYTFQSIMDALVRGGQPTVPLWSGILIAGLASALVFYAKPPPSNAGGHPAGITRFVAGIMIVVGFNLVFFNILTLDVLNSYAEMRSVPNLWIAQCVSATIVLLFAPLYRKTTRTSLPSARPTWPPLAANLYGWARLVLVSIVLIPGNALVSARTLRLMQNQPVVTTIRLGPSEFAVTLPMLGAGLAALAVAALMYWPPPFRRVTYPLWLVRLLVLFLAITAIGLLYREILAPIGYLNAMVLGTATAVLTVPVQRTLS